MKFLTLRWLWMRWKEQATIRIAWLLPRKLAYWAFVRVATFQCTGNPCERTCLDAVKAWDGGR